MFVRKTGMFARHSNPIINKNLLLMSPPHAYLTIYPIIDIGTGTSKELTNNFVPGSNNEKDIKKENELYINESLIKFKKTLQPNHLHIFMCPTLLDVKPMLAGHIASFVTDSMGKIIDKTVMSLQNDRIYLNAEGNPVRIISNLPKVKPDWLYTIRFLSMEEELSTKFFKYTVNLSFKKPRYLFSVPITLEQSENILNNTESTKTLLKDKTFQLYDSMIDGKLSKARNCCLGFYKAMGVIGNRSDPSPQVVTWSFLKFFYKNVYNDESLRDKLMTGSRLKEISTITVDDKLESDTNKPKWR